MTRARILQEVRQMQLEELYERRQRRDVTLAESAEILGVTERTFRRSSILGHWFAKGFRRTAERLDRKNRTDHVLHEPDKLLAIYRGLLSTTHAQRQQGREARRPRGRVRCSNNEHRCHRYHGTESLLRSQ